MNTKGNEEFKKRKYNERIQNKKTEMKMIST